MSQAVEVIADLSRAQSLMSEVRLRLLDLLASPASAAALGRLLDLPRQRLNYHLRALEAQGLIELVEQRKRGNVTERIYRRSAQSYTISPATLGSLQVDPGNIPDRFSAAYQIALNSRSLAELARLRRGADAAGKLLPTFALDTELRFADAATRAAFAEELAAAVTDLVRRYHDGDAPNGRAFRLYLGAYPRPRDGEAGPGQDSPPRDEPDE